ncbi:toprim domain-containing protein [Paenibacillus sp. HJL G12]|uniref:Toprim domain-containing protein n=2 Tax=Paenibacillus dendrobii TaxID=2691084 RepID=A0A7X3LH15_9BACL|nr:toprim domain-containing protein [Paenibacillus dendrobii]
MIEELRFLYQHQTRYANNPKALTGINCTNDWIMCCCPIHTESRPSFGISRIPPYHCNCFVCGYLGTIDILIENVLGLEAGEGVKILLSSNVIEEKYSTFDIVEFIENRRNSYEIPHLDEGVLQNIKDSREKNESIYRSGIEYMKQRGFDDHTLSTYEICVDTITKTIVFPQRTRTGHLRFIQKRKIGGNDHGAKFINEGMGIKKDIVFGLHFFNKLKTTAKRIAKVRLVESPTDCMSNYQVGIPAISINGRILFRNQVREIQLAGITEVDLMLDNDIAGDKGMDHAAGLLDRAGLVVNRVRYPDFPMLKDSNELFQAGYLDKLETHNVNLIGSLFK